LDPSSLIIATLSTSAGRVLTEAIKQAVIGSKKHDITIEVDGNQVHVTDTDALSPTNISRLAELLKTSSKHPDSTIALSRVASQNPSSTPVQASISDKKVGATALAISPEAVFTDARRRMSMVFQLNLAVAIALAVILVGGIGGAVFSAVVLQKSIWSIAFGGVSAADLLGLYVFKPLSAMNASLVGTQRLEMLQLQLSQQLSSCEQLPSLEERIKCQATVWDTIQQQLAKL
jgi:hypothetical protein